MDHFRLQTDHLLIEAFTIYDTAFIIELLNTEGWLKYIGDKKVHNTADACRYLKEGPIKSYDENGFGLWKISLKTGMPIGMCGLLKRPGLPFPDLGFAFLPQFGGKGYAVEAAARTIEYGFLKIQLQTILAITMKENVRSANLLLKIGMRYEKNMWMTQPDGELEMMLYRIDNPTL
jgi:[ribosomal protein S5]-alanine N-acetyltransferase